MAKLPRAAWPFLWSELWVVLSFPQLGDATLRPPGEDDEGTKE